MNSASAEEVLKGYAGGRRAFVNLDLTGADFHGAELKDANFFGGNLQGADFHKANLTRVNFGHCNLRGANLTGAIVGGAFLQDADLTDVKMEDVVDSVVDDFVPSRLPVIQVGESIRPSEVQSATAQGSDIFCMYCGAALPRAARFCFQCGKEQPLVPSSSNLSRSNLPQPLAPSLSSSTSAIAGSGQTAASSTTTPYLPELKPARATVPLWSAASPAMPLAQAVSQTGLSGRITPSVPLEIAEGAKRKILWSWIIAGVAGGIALISALSSPNGAAQAIIVAPFIAYMAWGMYWGLAAVWSWWRKLPSTLGCAGQTFTILGIIIFFYFFFIAVEIYGTLGGGIYQYVKARRLAQG